MKKPVLCALLALLTLISAAAVAENANCCACCSAAVGASQNDDTDYEQEIVVNDFHIFFPLSFEAYQVQRFKPSNGNEYPLIMINPLDGIGPSSNAFYSTQDELHKAYEAYIDGSHDYSIIQIDECLGLRYLERSADLYFVTLYATNRRNFITIDIISDSLDEALELAQGIIDHAVAKEVPLQELEQAE